MADIISTSLTFEKEDVNMWFNQPQFLGDQAMQRFDLMTNVKSSFRLQKFAAVEKVTKAFSSGFTGSTGSTLTQRVITVNRTKAEVSQEANTFYNTVAGEWLARGTAKDKLEMGEQLKDIVSGIFNNAVSRDLSRQVWLSDTAGGAGADYDIYDGIFKQYVALPAAQKIVGPVGALAVDAAVAQFQAAIDAMPDEFRELKGDAVLEISGSYADNYRATLRATGTEIADGVLRDGEENLSYDGVPIIVHRDWDTHIAADALATDVHRIVLHIPKNVVIGTDFDAASVDFWYNPDVIENRYRASYAIGTNYKNDEFAVTVISA
jgi:hypothetical protein